VTHHHAHSESFGGRLLISMIINLIIPAAQIAGGLVSGSMALISDAVHNLGDFGALVMAYGAHRAGRRGPSLRHTFGLQRLEILAAMLNAALLSGAAVFIAVEAMKRLAAPGAIDPVVVAWLALLGVAGNGLSAWLLHKDSEHNLNARGAFLHMMGDMLTSVAVLVGALVIRVASLPWLDPALSLVIVAYILWNSLALLKAAVHVLMNGAPIGLDLESVRTAMEAMDGVSGVHYLHAWSIGDCSVALTCHVVVADQMISATESLAHRIGEMLLDGFGIDHPVLQFETRACGQGELLCRKTGCNGGS
jgi:cobalt-zinc-cadmium efflux system protein